MLPNALVRRKKIGGAARLRCDSCSRPGMIWARPLHSRFWANFRPCQRNFTMTKPLTVLIPCKNEREHLAACIRSVKDIAAEVLVADSGSTDGSLDIARSHGARVIEREYVTSGDFKNWAIPQAANHWVLIVDSDERVTPALAAEIHSELNRPEFDGYRVRRQNHFLGHVIHHGPWKNDCCLRLFRRDMGRYVGPTDHAEVELRSGRVGDLSERLVHYTCTSYEQYLPKIHRYAAVQARVWFDQGRRTSPLQLLLRGPLRFLQGYILRRGFLDGLAGLQVCAMVAYLSYLKHARLWELERARCWRDLEASYTAKTGPNSKNETVIASRSAA